MTTKLLRLVPWLIIIFILLLWGYCSKRAAGEVDAWKQAKLKADRLREASDRDRSAQRDSAFQYQNNAQQAQYEAKQADTAKRRALAQVSSLQASLRQIQARRATAPPEVRHMIDSTCCDLAITFGEVLDSFRIVDSTKDHAVAVQLDLAGAEVTRLNGSLEREQERYDLLDSLNRSILADAKPRGKFLIGVGGGVNPAYSWGGVKAGWLGKRGTLYQFGAGPGTGGLFVEGGIYKTISFRKRRMYLP